MEQEKNAKRKKSAATNCESCEFYDYDEDMGTEVCTMDLDEDEYYRFISGAAKGCPYYRYYDEYAMVRKQN